MQESPVRKESHRRVRLDLTPETFDESAPRSTPQRAANVPTVRRKVGCPRGRSRREMVSLPECPEALKFAGATVSFRHRFHIR